MTCFDYPFDSAYILQKKRALKRELLQKDGLIKKNIAIMSGSTIGDIKNVLELFLLHNGIEPNFYEGGYSLFYENIVFDDGSLAAFKPDIIYIHTSCQNLKNKPSQFDSADICEQKIAAEYGQYETVWKAATRFACPIIQNNFELPQYRIMGNKDAYDCHGVVNFTRKLNAKFADYAQANSNFYINDIEYLSASVGLENWFSATTWYAYKYALDVKYIPTLCHSVANIIKSVFGKNKKALVLDLDNTLWGGIIGDDGPEGIIMGNETPAGMAFAQLQAYLKELSQLGILLNVCSKNEESIAKQGFERADSILKYEDFLCFKANWEPKHINIDNIAKELNILQDSFVFMDDNPAEREIVSRELNGVSVIALTSAEDYTKYLDHSGYFEVTTISNDDRKRNEMYKQNLDRNTLVSNFGDYTDYLKSLNMQCEIGTIDKEHSERITQLINKTNQFNLTTKRYTSLDIEKLIDNPSYITLYGRLIDKFGDNGIVTVLIGHINNGELDIDLWIMSCRTFKRHLEYAMFDQLISQCINKNISAINGFYYPTAKNLLTADFYATIGFNIVSDTDSEKRFKLSLNKAIEPMCNVMEIKLV